MSYLHAKREGHRGERMGNQGPLWRQGWLERPWRLWRAPHQGAVNKASAEFENGNEFLIGDTLYLSSWQWSDCAVAFLGFVLVCALLPLRCPRIPSLPPFTISCRGPSRVKKEEEHNNWALSWMITLNYSSGSLKVLDKPPFFSFLDNKSFFLSLQPITPV